MTTTEAWFYCNFHQNTLTPDSNFSWKEKKEPYIFKQNVCSFKKNCLLNESCLIFKLLEIRLLRIKRTKQRSFGPWIPMLQEAMTKNQVRDHSWMTSRHIDPPSHPKVSVSLKTLCPESKKRVPSSHLAWRHLWMIPIFLKRLFFNFLFMPNLSPSC